MTFWGVVLLIVVSFMLFGYLIDKRTNRYKRITDKQARDGIEAIKDDVQKQNPSNINNTGPW